MKIKPQDRYNLAILLLSVFCAVLATASVIYFTPLRYVSLIVPTLNETDPKVFYVEYQKHPNDYIFVDVRSASIYLSAHAKGAINIPIENLYDEHYTLPRTGKKIALICTTGRLAAIAYGYLEYWGFTNLIHIQGGLVNWTYEDLPVEGLNVAGLSLGTTTVLKNVIDEHQ